LNDGNEGSFGSDCFTVGGDGGEMVTAGSPDLAKYVEWTIAPGAGNQMTITDLQLNIGVQDSDAADTFEVRYSVDSYAAPLFTLSNPSNGDTLSNIPVSSVVNTTEAVTFRSYWYGGNNGYITGWFGIRNTDGGQLTVNGIVTSVSPPAAPSNLIATAAGIDQIDLTWQDNSADEDGFKVESSPNGTTGWTEIGTVGAGVTTYPDTGLVCDTTYYYRVLAYNTNGDSGTSNTDSATTDPCAPPPSYTIIVTTTATELQMSIPTVSGKVYRLLENTSTPDLNAAGWTDTGHSLTGDGTVQVFTVSKPVSGSIFYTIEYEE